MLHLPFVFAAKAIFAHATAAAAGHAAAAPVAHAALAHTAMAHAANVALHQAGTAAAHQAVSAGPAVGLHVTPAITHPTLLSGATSAPSGLDQAMGLFEESFLLGGAAKIIEETPLPDAIKKTALKFLEDTPKLVPDFTASDFASKWGGSKWGSA